MPLYKIVVPSANRIISLKSRDPRNAYSRLGGWRFNHPDAYLTQAVEVIDDFGNTYVLRYQPVPVVGGW